MIDVLCMKTNRPFIRVLFLGMLIAVLMGSAAMAKTGSIGFLRLAATSKAAHPAGDSSRESDDQGTSDEQESDDQGTSDEQESGDQGISDEQESSDCDTQDQGKTEDGGTTPGDNGDREKACNEAAGITDETASGNEVVTTKPKGLDNAIQHVLANCIKNPQAPGLLNALRHLVANRDRHAAHDAEKAARRAAHEAAKAERGSTKGSKGHG